MLYKQDKSKNMRVRALKDLVLIQICEIDF